jgi:hypothetical protein
LKQHRRGQRVPGRLRMKADGPGNQRQGQWVGDQCPAGGAWGRRSLIEAQRTRTWCAVCSLRCTGGTILMEVVGQLAPSVGSCAISNTRHGDQFADIGIGFDRRSLDRSPAVEVITRPIHLALDVVRRCRRRSAAVASRRACYRSMVTAACPASASSSNRLSAGRERHGGRREKPDGPGNQCQGQMGR